MNVLVVDDQPCVADSLALFLRALGNDCFVAREADEADRILEREFIDAVIVDFNMPGRNGLQWLESLENLRPELLRHTLVITGARLQVEDRRRLSGWGAGLLNKPFPADQLLEAFQRQVATI
jgi:two-component system response regulator HupR/HoxA